MTEMPVLHARNVSMKFGEALVLDNVDVEFYAGRVYGVVGENGAGKSTLMRILSGFLQPISGQIHFEGKQTVLNPQRAKHLGIVLVPQELNLVEPLRVYENIFLGDEPVKHILIDRKAMIDRSSEIIKSLDVQIDPAEPVEKLSTGKKQMVEIMKALSRNVKILIMDEPTASLSEDETNKLFETVRKLRDSGIAVIFVSHRLKEIIQIADELVVLRDGKKVYQGDLSNFSEAQIAEMMVGRKMSEIYPEKPTIEEKTVFEVQNLSSTDGKIKDVSFALKNGEILGFYGLVGAGRTELMQTIIGIRKLSSGEIFVDGKPTVIKSVKEAMKNGIVYLPEERKLAGLVLNFEVFKNTTLMALDKISKIFTKPKVEVERFEYYRKSFDIRVRSPYQITRTLSGGNQQKLVLSKLVETGAKIFMLDEPTRGVDINSRYQIYKIISELASKKLASFIVISSDLPEIIGLCNRVIVMRDGEVVGEATGDGINEANLIYLALGFSVSQDDETRE
ncbi:MAG TPA: sugar ABC transporter ATP-binding protein [Fervidobacterium sp.]|nr:ABC transporter ATP-binding protein [Fervidobacterium sp.]HOM74048.1 sugar ABC transporter ATP-binding protein [Fervidobacterium sp.]HPP17693.1 sugar ABC transporter ATP-binding protein [Fervidobacterium sp.]HRD20270.1 sugar ABC transporter ATP-binding protein [Fervidobacterium sp.]